MANDGQIAHTYAWHLQCEAPEKEMWWNRCSHWLCLPVVYFLPERSCWAQGRLLPEDWNAAVTARARALGADESRFEPVRRMTLVVLSMAAALGACEEAGPLAATVGVGAAVADCESSLSGAGVGARGVGAAAPEAMGACTAAGNVSEGVAALGGAAVGSAARRAATNGAAAASVG